MIPAVLITGLNSDLPGKLLAQVNHDMCDSRSGRHDPARHQTGRRLQPPYGDGASSASWWSSTACNTPDDSTLELGGMASVDATGYTGFFDQADNHYAKIFGNATLLAIIGAGVQLAIPSSDDDNGDEDPAEALKVETARQWGEVGHELSTQELKDSTNASGSSRAAGSMS